MTINVTLPMPKSTADIRPAQTNGYVLQTGEIVPDEPTAFEKLVTKLRLQESE